MGTTIKNHLKELGFSGNETRVYIALTCFGESTAATIAKKAALKRTTSISILEKMAREHYVSQHTHRGTNYYWIESPSVLRENSRTVRRLRMNSVCCLRGLSKRV